MCRPSPYLAQRYYQYTPIQGEGKGKEAQFDDSDSAGQLNYHIMDQLNAMASESRANKYVIHDSEP